MFSDATTAVASLRYSGLICLLPEPGSWLLLSAGVAALALRGRRRQAPGVATGWTVEPGGHHFQAAASA